MKLTKDRVKEITAQVYKDLNIYHSNKYPIECTFVENDSEFKRAIWSTGYDYRDPEAVGDKNNYGDLSCVEAIAYHYYTGHLEIKLNKTTGKYEAVKQMYRP